MDQAQLWTMGQKLAEKRMLLHVSQEELAEELGITRATLSRIERGAAMPRLDTLLFLSRRLGVSMSILFSEESSGEQNRLLSRVSALSPDRQETFYKTMELVLTGLENV